MFMTTIIQPKAKTIKVEIFFSVCMKNIGNAKIDFDGPENKTPKEFYGNIFSSTDGTFLKIFYLETEKEKQSSLIEIKFKLNKQSYVIKIKSQEIVSFVFKPTLEKDNYFMNSKIEQDIVDFKDKFIGFYKALDSSNKLKYEDILIKEGIKTFKFEATFNYFILLFSYCYKDNRLIKELFSAFKPEMRHAIVDKVFINLKETIEDIYKNKQNILNNTPYIDDTEKNIFYFSLLYYFLRMDDKNKLSQITKELYEKERNILFQILKKYSSFFQSFKLVNKELLNELISDSKGSNFNDIKNSLAYEKDVVAILEVLSDNKNIIYNCMKESNEVVNISEFVEQKKNDNIEKICNLITSLIEFQEEKECFFIDFREEFWKFYVNSLIENDLENIEKLIKLRECLKNYQKYLSSKKKLSKEQRKLIEYSKTDYYALSIDALIKSLINIKRYDNLDLLDLIFEKDPYNKEVLYKNKRTLDLFKLINFKNIKDEKFFEKFKNLKLDEVFEQYIDKFFEHIFSSISNIFDFQLVYKLFSIEEMSENGVQKYIYFLKKKFKEITINFNNESDNNKIINLIVILVDIIIRKQENTANKFLVELEKKLREKICIEIYLQLLEVNNDIKNENLLKYIFSKIMISNNNINYSIRFLSNTKDNNQKTKFLENLKDNIFDFKDFFMGDISKKVELFLSLKNKNLIDENCDYYKDISKTIDELKEKFQNFLIDKEIIDVFLRFQKEEIIKRLRLISDNPINLYNEIKDKKTSIDKEIQLLYSIEKELSLYHSDNEIMKKIQNLISSLEKGKINEINEESNRQLLNQIKAQTSDLVEKIQKVEDSIYFNKIYEDNRKRFNNEKSDKIFEISIKELDKKVKIIEDPETLDKKDLDTFLSMISNTNKIKDEINKLSKYFEINVDINLIEDKMIILYNKKKYTKDLKKIIFFFEKINVSKTNNFLNKMKEFIEAEESTDKKQYENLKKHLTYLKEKNIYDYFDEENKNIKFYDYFYDNELAIAFLLDKNPNDAKALTEKIEPGDFSLSNGDLIIFENCLRFIEDLKIKDKKNKDEKIFYEIKKKIMEDNSILINFKNYCDNFSSIKKLYEDFDEENSISKKVEENINNGVFYFYKYHDEYKIKDKLIENGYEYLYDLKCKINIRNVGEKEENDLDKMLKEKNEKLKYFVDLVDKIRTINYYVNFLRNKGSQIELIIEIHFCFNENKEGKFILGNDKTNLISFDEIKNYLKEVKE